MLEALIVGAPLALFSGGALVWCERRLTTRLDALERSQRNAERHALAATETLAALREDAARDRDALRRLGREIESLAADVTRREVYRDGVPRHVGAIDAVRGGLGAEELVREHGLCLDEAELLVTLHAQRRDDLRTEG